MGTLGCINDMQRRDKENRELRKLGRERIKETRTRLSKIGKGTKLPEISAQLQISVTYFCSIGLYFLV